METEVIPIISGISKIIFEKREKSKHSVEKCSFYTFEFLNSNNK